MRALVPLQPENAEHGAPLSAPARAAFNNYFIDFAVCCPSRTSYLTGKCLHNSGAVYPTGPLGGFSGFTRYGNDKSTIFKWLRDSGLGYKVRALLLLCSCMAAAWCRDTH